MDSSTPQVDAAAAPAAPEAPASTSMLPWPLSAVPTSIWTILALVLAGFVQLYRNQEALLYHPAPPGLPSRRTSQNPAPFNSPSGFDLPFESVKLRASDGVGIDAWLVKTRIDPAAAPTIIFCHANAGNMGLRLPNVQLLTEMVGVNVFIFDYRGYGDSDEVERITEEGLMRDATAVFEHVLGRADIDKRKLFVFGRSLGGAVAVQAAAAFPDAVRGVILENTFTSIPDMVDHIFPLLSYVKGALLRIKWATEHHIRRLPHHMLFISAGKDEIVPPPMMARLHAAATTARSKTMYTVPEGGHNDAYQKGGVTYFRRVRAFIDDALAADLGDSARIRAPTPDAIVEGVLKERAAKQAAEAAAAAEAASKKAAEAGEQSAAAAPATGAAPATAAPSIEAAFAAAEAVSDKLGAAPTVHDAL